MIPTLRDKAEQHVLDCMREMRVAVLAYKSLHNALPPCMKDGTVARLDDAFLAGARVFADRHSLVRALAQGAAGAEIGVQNGHFSRFLLDHCAVDTLHLFDTNTSLIRDDVRSDPRVAIHHGDSSSRLKALPDAALDWIYIDGDHSYEGVKKDVEASLAKVRKGGVLFFNDYTLWSPGEVIPYGIVPVVNDLVNNGHHLLGIGLNPWGYFDMALQR